MSCESDRTVQNKAGYFLLYSVLILSYVPRSTSNVPRSDAVRILLFNGVCGVPDRLTRSCPLTIQHAQVTADQVDFPVLVSYNATANNETNLPDELMQTGNGNAAQADGETSVSLSMLPGPCLCITRLSSSPRTRPSRTPGPRSGSGSRSCPRRWTRPFTSGITPRPRRRRLWPAICSGGARGVDWLRGSLSSTRRYEPHRQQQHRSGQRHAINNSAGAGCREDGRGGLL